MTRLLLKFPTDRKHVSTLPCETQRSHNVKVQRTAAHIPKLDVIITSRTRIRDINHLRARLVEEWQKLDQKIIDCRVNQWRRRLRACVQEEGGHFEHKL